jgi:hypothetical protein
MAPVMPDKVRRRHTKSVFLALILVAALTGCGRGDPDPDGRILTALKSVEAALPSDATVVRREYIEPKWDSCDARPETEGWSDVMVLLEFQTDMDPEVLGEHAGRALELAGWVDDGVSATPYGRWWSWTQTLADGTVARAGLAPTAVEGSWELSAVAPPHGRRVSGC